MATIPSTFNDLVPTSLIHWQLENCTEVSKLTSVTADAGKASAEGKMRKQIRKHNLKIVQELHNSHNS